MGGANPEEVIRSLGYAIEWEGLDYEKSKVARHESQAAVSDSEVRDSN